MPNEPKEHNTINHGYCCAVVQRVTSHIVYVYEYFLTQDSVRIRCSNALEVTADGRHRYLDHTQVTQLPNNIQMVPN